MPLPPRLFPGDEELGKRDDDHKPGSKTPLKAVWQTRRLPIRRNIKRLAIALTVVVALYYFFKNMPTNLEHPHIRPSYTHSPVNKTPAQSTKTTTHHETSKQAYTPYIDDVGSEDKLSHWFNGPIKFYDLAVSLHAIAATRGSSVVNRNVLFTASSLKSAGTLLPLACEMASWNRNHIHFAFMGRDNISIEMLKEVNGVAKECNIWFHDARPDFSLSSTDYRMEVSSGAALGHINTFMHPQAVIIDSSKVEDDFFHAAMASQSRRIGITLIKLPSNAEQHLRWFTRLDSASLKAWNRFSIDIVIHAQPSASGSLMRLLGSLWNADYFSSPPPRLTIELPHNVDEPTRHFLADSFTWPPNSDLSDTSSNQFTLHHRIPQPGLSPEENSIRFLESFWPADPATSHLLILSPHAELSPLYFQYLKYMTLEYKYSLDNLATSPDLLGISLDLPSTYLNDTSAFTPPVDQSSTIKPKSPTSFLWQAPNSNAALYFGDKWVELHSLVGHILASSHSRGTPTTLNTKQVSNTWPSWLEHVLSLARIRGYYTLYPILDNQESLVTIHNELYQPPEEFRKQFLSDKEELVDTTADLSSTIWTVDPAKHLSSQHTEMPLASTLLLNLLPHNQLPLVMDKCPLLSWDGLPVSESELQAFSKAYTDIFTREVGGCGPTQQRPAWVGGDADDLFCLDKEDVVPTHTKEDAPPAVVTSPAVEDLGVRAVPEESLMELASGVKVADTVSDTRGL